jgi:peptide-methionine (S)-S-oxide reductase
MSSRNLTNCRAAVRRWWPVAAALIVAFGIPRLAPAETAKVVAAPSLDTPAVSEPGRETAVLAGGCFWGVQAVFQHVTGVTQAVSGYAGGSLAAPSYEAVSSGLTGHAESVAITFDPKQISYGRVLQIYFSVAHDPTEHNRQGPDVGTQYRSEIFTTTPAQLEVAEAYIRQLDETHAFSRPIATQVVPLMAFYPAEAYHQDYATLHPQQPYIAYNDLPKIAALQRLFPDRYRPEPVLVGSAKPAN